MVVRKLNKPTFKIGQYPTFWLQEMQKSEWFCRGCSPLNSTQKAGTVAFEMYVRYAKKNAKSKDEPIRLYLCMNCAEEMLETSLDKVRLVKQHGAVGFKMFDEV